MLNTPPRAALVAQLHLVSCPYNHCDVCSGCADDQELRIHIADLCRGAFIAVLCSQCWHRCQYRAELERRLAERRAK